jgi:AcrR family transcriptional regulator
MNRIITSKEEILEGSKKLIGEKGLNALDMRSLAQFLNVSVGTLYNYFPSKGILIESSVEAVFKDIFHESRSYDSDFLSLLDGLYKALADGEKKYPGFFSSHSYVFSPSDKSQASKMKEMSRNHLEEEMKIALEKDPKLRKDAFKNIDEKEFIDLVFTSLLYTYLEKKREIETLKKMVSCIIY